MWEVFLKFMGYKEVLRGIQELETATEQSVYVFQYKKYLDNFTL